mgnify:CR=1 FL=1|tara:strand:+ start:981 stop:2117 length:1137 start_codon:yes stop_codon:yes gene_type:complete
MKKKIAVIGSGIAGLTAANLFKTNSDFEVMVYEREKTLSLEEGYGIQLAPNSVSILNKIGFSNISNNNFFNPSKLNFYSIDNNKICDLNLTRFNRDTVKYTTLKRSILVEFLKNNLFANNIKFGKEVKKVSKIKEKLLINFADNTNDLVDFIIISDGVFSKTKLIIENKNIKPRYNGSIAIRKIIKSSEEFSYENENISLIMFPNAHIVIYPVNKNNELNLVCIVRQKSFLNKDLHLIIKKEILSQNKNLENLFKGHLESWPIYLTKKPTKSIYENLFYLGDAFYTFPPTMAQGAGQSIEGAKELFDLLSQDSKEIQNLYFKKRLERTKLIDNRSRLNYFSFHLSNPLMVKIRNVMLKKITKNEKLLDRYLGNIYQTV